MKKNDEQQNGQCEKAINAEPSDPPSGFAFLDQAETRRAWLCMAIMAACITRAGELLKAGWCQGARYADREGIPQVFRNFRTARYCLHSALEVALQECQMGVLVGFPDFVDDVDEYISDGKWSGPYSKAFCTTANNLQIGGIGLAVRKLLNINVALTAWNDNPHMIPAYLLAQLKAIASDVVGRHQMFVGRVLANDDTSLTVVQPHTPEVAKSRAVINQPNKRETND